MFADVVRTWSLLTLITVTGALIAIAVLAVIVVKAGVCGPNKE